MAVSRTITPHPALPRLMEMARCKLFGPVSRGVVVQLDGARIYPYMMFLAEQAVARRRRRDAVRRLIGESGGRA